MAFFYYTDSAQVLLQLVAEMSFGIFFCHVEGFELCRGHFKHGIGHDFLHD